MKKFNSWTASHERYLRMYYPKVNKELIAKRLGRSVEAVRSRATLLGIVIGKRKFFTDLEIRYVRRYYATGDTKKIAERLGVPIMVLYQKARALGLSRDKEMVLEYNRGLGKALAEKNLGKRFEKGMVPVNKGKKQADFMSPEGIAKTMATRFKSGQDPHNTKPIGYERVTVDGYVEVKVRHTKDSTKNFVLKNRLVWEQNFGPVPEGMVVEFIDGDKRNFAPLNLRVVTRLENVRNNTLSDSAIVKRVFKEREPEKIEEIIEKHPEVIDLKRNAIKVGWLVRDYKKGKNNGTLGTNSGTGTPG